MVADLHHLDEEQDLDPHFRENPDPDLQPHSTPWWIVEAEVRLNSKPILMLLKDIRYP